MKLRPRVFAVVVMAACASESTITPGVLDDGANYFPAASWRTAEPAAVGFNAAAIARLQADIVGSTYGAIDGVLIVRNGYLVLETYRNWASGNPHTLQSVTKSVTSLLVGILAERDARLQLDQAVLPLFPRYASIANVDHRKRALTVRHLLTMRTSMDFWEQPYPGSPLDQLNRSSDDWVKFVLDRPMNGTPGSAWAYNSGAPIVMCGVIRELTGEAVQQFARRTLFEPIGITGERWAQSSFDALPHCGGGLSLKPSDLARIGYLVLRNGRWRDRQILSRAWLDASTAPVSRGSEVFFSSYNSAYGYYWWLFPRRRGGSDTGVIAGSGSGGQWLFIVPELDLVVAIAASNGNGLDLLYNGVLPALN